MKSLSTFMFMLRWQFIPFICGIAITIFAIMGLSSPKPIEIANITSVASMLWPIPYVGIVAGPALILWAWRKAALLRGG